MKNFFAISLVVIGLSVTGQLQAQGESPERWLSSEFKLFRVYPRLDRAERFYAQGRYQETRDLLDQVIRIDAYNQQAMRLLIETCLRVQDYPCATSTATSLESLPATRAIGAYYLMLDAERLGDHAQVLRWGEVVLSDVRSTVTQDELALVMQTMAEAYSYQLVGNVAASVANPLQQVEEASVSQSGSAPDQQTEQDSPEQSDQTVSAILEVLAGDFSLASEETLFQVRLLDMSGQYQEALDLAISLPDGTSAHQIQADLLEKLNRPGDAASVLFEQGNPVERRDASYWARLFDLFGQAGMRSAQFEVLTAAEQFIASNPVLLTMASILFLEESNEFLAAAGQTQIDSVAFDLRREQIQRLMVLIANNGNVGEADAYRLYRTDAEIMLIGEFLDQGDEAAALTLIERVTAYPDLNFDQVNALIPVLWGMGRCPEIVASMETMSAGLSSGQRLLLASCAQRLSRRDLALAELELLLATDMPAAEALVLRKTQGYLALESGDHETAYFLWSALLEEVTDSQLALSTAYTAVLMEDWDEVERLLELVNVDDLAPAAMSQYWQTQAWLALHFDAAVAAAEYYRQALIWDSGNTEIWAPLARTAERAGLIEMAEIAWEEVISQAVDNVVYRSEYAYFLGRQENHEQAVVQFQAAVALAPYNSTLRHDLVFAQLANGNSAAATESLRLILSDSERLGDSSQRRYEDQLTLSNISQRWVLELGGIARLDEGVERVNNPGIRNNSYAGYSSLSATYLPRFGIDDSGGQRLFTGVRLYTGNADQSFSPETENRVLAIGGRYKLFRKYAIFASAEQLFGLGNNAQDDTLLRLSGSFFSGLGWPYSDLRWNYQNLYLDAAYFTHSETHYATIEMERGRVFRVGDEQASFGLMPYFRLGAAINNDNASGSSESRIDAGLGLSLMGRHWRDDALGHKAVSRTSLVFSQKIAGNTEDDFAIQFRVNLRF